MGQSLTMTVQRSWRAGPLVLCPRGRRLGAGASGVCQGLFAAAAATVVVPGCRAALRKLITWVSQARGTVARPRVCPACGTTHTWTVTGEAP